MTNLGLDLINSLMIKHSIAGAAAAALDLFDDDGGAP
jgi:hypothetical protein